ncbi:MAG: TetR/AcrR family transcriptional regulator, partial [Treponema sp.]|nr:TetR/AcrR family transcriptional regulator [Treponema sp.]
MGIRQEARERRREEILEAALDLFVSKGYAQTKIGDIAEKVGMSVGLLFHYFESKARLYEELVLIGAQGPISIAEEDARDPARFLEGAAEYVL